MSTTPPPPPPPTGPPPSGPPPSGPPPSGPPSGPPPPFPPGPQQPTSNRLPWIVGGVVVLVLAVVVVLVVTLTGSKAASDARSVQDVADLSVEAAEDLDVDKGVDLLCEAPSDDRLQDLRNLITDGQDEAGTEDPDIDYKISDVQGDAEGSFVVTITSDEERLRGSELVALVKVGQDGSRSCIDEITDPDNLD